MLSKNIQYLSNLSEEKLEAEEEQKCRDIVNSLHEEMMKTFSEYRIPPTFFGPLQFVDYEGIGGNYIESVEDVEFVLPVGGPD